VRCLSVFTECLAAGRCQGAPHAAPAGRAAQVHYTANEKPHIQNDTITINHRFAGAPPARRARQASCDAPALAQRRALPAHAQGLSLLSHHALSCVRANRCRGQVRARPQGADGRAARPPRAGDHLIKLVASTKDLPEILASTGAAAPAPFQAVLPRRDAA